MSHVIDVLSISNRRKHLLSSSTLPLKALTSALTLICLSAFLVYPFPTFQRRTLWTPVGHTPNRTLWIGIELITKLLYGRWHQSRRQLCSESSVITHSWLMLLNDDTNYILSPWSIRESIDNFQCNNWYHTKIPCAGMGLQSEHDLTSTPWYVGAIVFSWPWLAKTGHFMVNPIPWCVLSHNQ